MIANDDRLHFGHSALAGFDTTGPDQAHKELANAHRRATENLQKVRTNLGEDENSNKIDVASLDAVGLRVAQEAPYSTPFARWAATHDVQTAKTRKEEIYAFIDFATAAVFVGATIGTMGGAAAVAAVLTGAATAGAVASAGVKFSNAADLQSTANAGIRPEKLTSQAKVNAADLDAAIAGALALLSLIAAAKGLKGLAGLFRRSSSVADELTRLKKLSAARASKVVQQSIQEVGPVQTAETAGVEVQDLLNYLDAETPEYKLTLDVALKLREATMKAATGVNFNGRPVVPTFQNFVGWTGTDLSPEALQGSGGFRASGTNTDLYQHIIAKGEPSALGGPPGFPWTPRVEEERVIGGDYVHEIEAGEAWDTEKIWQENQTVATGGHPLRGEYEIAIRGDVPWERVKGWRQVDERGPAGKRALGQYVSRAEWEISRAAAKK